MRQRAAIFDASNNATASSQFGDGIQAEQICCRRTPCRRDASRARGRWGPTILECVTMLSDVTLPRGRIGRPALGV